MKILPSALKHGIEEEEIRELFYSTHNVEIQLSPGNLGERWMLIGFVQRFNFPLELGVEQPWNKDYPVIFHADKSREPYLSRFEGKKHGKKKK